MGGPPTVMSKGWWVGGWVPVQGDKKMSSIGSGYHQGQIRVTHSKMIPISKMATVSASHQ